MTEAEWLVCNEPELMLRYLGSKGTDRKLRLFVCACSRRVWDLQSEQSREWFETLEQLADGLATTERGLPAASGPGMPTWEAVEIQLMMASDAAYAKVPDWEEPSAEQDWEYDDAEKEEWKWQSSLVRDIFGNPFRPPAVSDPSWLRWNDGTVVKIAQAIYDERRFEDMPILADALEDAGCDNEDILRHCREPGEHVRGCWVVDLILEKE